MQVQTMVQTMMYTMQHFDPEEAKAIKEDAYIDDGVTGHSEWVVKRMVGEHDDGEIQPVMPNLNILY